MSIEEYNNLQVGDLIGLTPMNIEEYNNLQVGDLIGYDKTEIMLYVVGVPRTDVSKNMACGIIYEINQSESEKYIYDIFWFDTKQFGRLSNSQFIYLLNKK